MRNYFPRSSAELVRWYERYISPISLVVGFLFDNLVILRRVDLWEGNVLLFFHLIMSATGIIVLNMIESQKIRHAWATKIAPYIPIAIQFSFGSLFSAYVSLYSRSASLPIGWIFVLILAALMIGNERFSRLYVRFSVQMPLYYLVLFSYLTFFLPVITHNIGPATFILSSAISTAIIVAFIVGLVAVTRTPIRERMRALYAVGALVVILNGAYFLNLIPPLPLSIKNAGVYHYVIKNNDGTYKLVGEEIPWYQQLLPRGITFHKATGESAYLFSAVFAPSGLTTTILHQWQYYDEAKKAWTTVNTVSFPINGGRDGGYRGYTLTSNLAEGKWRVNVITQYGQLIGRVSFTVVDVNDPVALSTTVR